MTGKVDLFITIHVFNIADLKRFSETVPSSPIERLRDDRFLGGLATYFWHIIAWLRPMTKKSLVYHRQIITFLLYVLHDSYRLVYRRGRPRVLDYKTIILT